jgi:hypothetical protein
MTAMEMIEMLTAQAERRDAEWSRLGLQGQRPVRRWHLVPASQCESRTVGRDQVTGKRVSEPCAAVHYPDR